MRYTQGYVGYSVKKTLMVPWEPSGSNGFTSDRAGFLTGYRVRVSYIGNILRAALLQNTYSYIICITIVYNYNKYRVTCSFRRSIFLDLHQGLCCTPRPNRIIWMCYFYTVNLVLDNDMTNFLTEKKGKSYFYNRTI